MIKKVKEKTLDTTTEARIKVAARTVFHKKGFAATRTRDIAKEADINLALLNYYFRSKEKLFEVIMLETLSGFIKNIMVLFNDEKTTLEKKIETFVTNYIDLLVKEPEIPIFILSEIRNRPDSLLENLHVKHFLMESVFFQQHQKAVAKGKIKEANLWHFMMNLLGLTVFPFIGKPILMGASGMSETEFNKVMNERKKLIPVWIKTIMKTT